MSEPLWKPSPERTAQANLTAFMEQVGRASSQSFQSYDDLYRWSVDHNEKFWEAIWIQAKISHSKPYSSVLSNPVMPGAKWFEGARLNFAENLLRYRDEQLALIGWNEHGLSQRVSYRELHARVSSCASGLRRLGVAKGDRVAAFIPNIPEAVIAMLATTSIGALWSSCSPDFGLQGVLDRFGQIEPTILFAAAGYQYQGNLFRCDEEVRQISSRIPSLQKVIIIPYLGAEPAGGLRGAMSWDNLLSAPSNEIAFEPLPFDHPVYIMYSSGTTGAPKCIVHGAGGTLLQHWKELALHTNLTRSDVVSYYTTCGWMMWNWLVSSLMVGSTILLYDGSPTHPNINCLWDLIDAEHLTVLGTSPKFLTSCQQLGLVPRTSHSLDSLKTILSTGSPLTAKNFAWVYRDVKSDLQLSSISGGTDIISCFMLGNPLLPVYTEEIQCRGLGMKVEAYDDTGRAVINQTGELVCTKPFPSMPIYFWNDLDGRKYRSAYFETYPGVWRHGDYIKITEHGGVVVYGRSDATLNPGGVRIGTAEIYNPVESMEEIVDSIVIGQKWNDDTRMVLFVVLASGLSLTEELKSGIRKRIREQYTPRHVPTIILQIKEVPRTRNGKKVEVAVAKMVHGEPITNREALANPESLKQFENFPELR